MKVFKNLTKSFLALVFVLFVNTAFSQTTYNWRAEAANGNWEVQNNWWDGAANNYPTGGEILKFDNNAQTTMTNDLTATNRHKIIFTSNASSSRTISGVDTNIFYDWGGTWPFVKNESTVLHTIGFPVQASNTAGINFELISQAGPLEFTSTINNDGRTIQIYGNNSVIDVSQRYIVLSGVLSGGGVLNVSQFGLVKLNAAHTYTGETQIDNGELWIEESGDITASSGIYVGNGAQMSNVAKLFLSDIDGGSTFSQNLTINPGNTNTRSLGSLNSSGINIFSGNITNNAGDLYLEAVSSGGITEYSGVISGAGNVHTVLDGKSIFSNNNTYTGYTIIEAGTLEFGISNAISNSSNLSLLGGTLSTGATTGYSDTLGTLTLNNDATINLGTGSHNLTFANSSGATWSAGKTLTIEGWGTGAEGNLFVGADATGLTAGQLAQIHFTGYNAGAYILATGEVVPVDYDSEVDGPVVGSQPTFTISSIADTEPEAVQVFDFDIYDYGTSDGLDTKITQITINAGTNNDQDWANVLAGVKLSTDGGTTFITTGIPIINSNSIVFPISSGDLIIPDGSAETISLFVWLENNGITDYGILEFEVLTTSHGFTADPSGSIFAETFSGAISDTIYIDVTATELQFTQQPSNTYVDTVMSPDVIVSATDENGNVDTDFNGANGTVQLTTTGTFDAGATDIVDAVNGIATFDNLIFSATGFDLTLTTLNAESLTETTSNPFNIFDAPETCSQLLISEYGNWNSSPYGNYVELYNPTDSTVDLSDYQVWRGTNGAWPSSGSSDRFDLTGYSIAAHDTFVLAVNTTQVPGADYTNSRMNFNGDDPIGLAWNNGSGTTFSLIDVVGDGTGDPDNNGFDAAGTEDATYNGSIIRKKTISGPNNDWSISRGTNETDSEWIVSSFTQANLFFHHSNCNYYPCSATEETAVFIDFDTNNTGWTTDASGNDTEYNYFDRVRLDYSGNNSDEVGSAVELYKSGSLSTDYFFGAQNTDDAPVSNAHPEFYINDIDITGLINLKLSLLIAEDDASDGHEDWDSNTSMHILYDIGNTGTFKNLLWVESTHPTDIDYPPAIDVDFNGVGNSSYTITDTFTEYTKDILGEGSEIDIKIVFDNLNNGTEDIAIDDIKITGDKIPTSTYSAAAWDTAPDAGRKATIDDNYNTSAGSISACNCTVNTDKTLTVAGGDHLLSVGAIVNNGTIVVENEGSLVQIDDDAVNSGTGTYQIHKTTPQYADYDYMYWSSPITDETAGSVFAANNPSYIWKYDTGNFLDLYDGYGHPQAGGSSDTFDDNGDDWVHVATGDILTPGVGYIAMGDDSDFPLDFANIEINNTDSVTFDGGTINNGEIQVSVEQDEYHVTGGSGADTFHTNANLIGNPYPSAIDISLFKMANPLLEGTFYFWMHDTQISSGGGPWAYNFTNDDYSTVAVDGAGVVSITGAGNGGGSSASRYIASGQGFFANVTGDGTLTFNNSMRVTGNNDTFRTPANNNIDKFWLNLSQENSTEIRQIYIGFHDQASDDYQAGQDAQRMENGDNLDFYSIIPGDERHFAIQNLATFNESKIVPLGVESREAGNYTINMVKGEGIFDNQVIYLFDYKYNLLHELSAMPYSFVINDTELGELENRFELRFVDGTAGVEEEVLNTLIVYPNPSNGQFYFNWNGSDTLEVQVFDIHGRMVQANTLTKGDSINMSHVQSGIYLAKIQVNGQQIVKKLVVR